MRHGMPCVGLIVFLGCFTFLVAPDDNFAPLRPTVEHPAGQHQAAALANQGAPPSLTNPTPQIARIGPPAPAGHVVLPGNGPPTVVIDPGHGGIDDGTKYFGLAEKDVTLDVAERLERILKSLRVETVLTRRDDVYVSLPDRAEIANMAAGTNSNVIFVSIHFNQSAVESVDGIETYYADKKIPPPTDWTWIGFFDRPEDEELDRGENLAADIQSALVGRMMETNRGIKSRSLFVTRHTRMPAVLVEGGFLSNKIENQMLRNDTYRERIAQGIAAGILAYVQTMHPTIPFRMATAAAVAD
jgi:N-acetylmuramoyl-L-alanine amidase